MRDPAAPSWPEVVAWAAPRHHVASRPELLALGVDRKQIARWLHSGRLFRIYDGVYAVGRRDLTREGRWAAALRWADPDSVLVGRSAAAYWGMRRSPESLVSIAVRDRRHLDAPADIRLRRPRRLLDTEVAAAGPLRVTTPARTLLDLAGLLGRDDLAAAIRAADGRRILDLERLRAVLAEHRSARGRRTLHALLERMEGWEPVTREALEATFADLVVAHGLPRPVMNTLIAGQLVDAVWRDARVTSAWVNLSAT